MKGMKCGFCKRWGHNEVTCYSKQRKELDDELARQRAEIHRVERRADAPQPRRMPTSWHLPRPESQKADTDVDSESSGEKEIVAVKRTPAGEPLPKNRRHENEEEQKQVSRPPLRLPSAPIPVPSRVSETIETQKKKSPRHKTSKTTVAKALGDRVEKYDVMNSLAQTPAGISFGQLLRGML